jgi:hypothetical protein
VEKNDQKKVEYESLKLQYHYPNLIMNEIITILNTLSPTFAPLTLKRLSLIVEAMLSMTGRVTMLGLSRWAEKGVSALG